MNRVMDILIVILKCFTFYTAVIGVFFILPRRKVRQADPKTRFAVFIPARNEETVIGQIVESLKKQNYPAALYDIVVIPNNCTDDTDGAARRAGAHVFACLGPVHSKGDALHQVFDAFLGKYDAYCVFDADNVVDPEFLARMNDEIAAGALVAKSRMAALNPYDSWITGCYDLYFENFNLLYSRPRDRVGLSAKLVGTGFMVTDTLMCRLGGWNTVTMAEDAEFAAQCAQAGARVHYVPKALTFDEEPLTFRESLRQRRRWSGGVMTVANLYLPKLLSRPTLLRLDLSVFFSGIYMQLLALLPAAFSLCKLSPAGSLGALAISLASFWISMTATALFLALTARRDVRKMWKTILLYPLFTISWYPLHILSLFSKPKTWKPIAHGSRRKLALPILSSRRAS